MKHRKVGSHQLNMESSRSHSIMTIYCDASPTGNHTGATYCCSHCLCMMQLAAAAAISLAPVPLSAGCYTSYLSALDSAVAATCLFLRGVWYQKCTCNMGVLVLLLVFKHLLLYLINCTANGLYSDYCV